MNSPSERCFQGRMFILYLVYLFWTAGLVAMVANSIAVMLVSSVLTLLAFCFYFLPGVRGAYMFIRKRESLPDAGESGADIRAGAASRTEDITVIGAGAVLDGNLSRGQGADIYGELTGDIILPEGTVRILPGGQVNGNISAPTVIIGGVVEGRCEGQTVTVLAQGMLRGTCRSAEFSIKPGGVFIGNAEAWPVTEPVPPEAGHAEESSKEGSFSRRERRRLAARQLTEEGGVDTQAAAEPEAEE
ncbi:TPA: polymer-forming cytoskeletal protein [Salmonella enterica]|uniref:Polymer-forming cytoskeletal protein n=1 Tax=Salmonella enterica TaxID=28901 RepID=A0A747SRR9_SALER|nr:polymer-forming cytoskeletal protein [Salmonella enterica]HAF4697577.1 polymer-forming cytoskeletal protein [Salmonella enterica]